MSSVWDRWARKPGNAAKAAAHASIILNEGFWSVVKQFCKLLKPIVKLMRLVDSNTPSMGKVIAVLTRNCISRAMLPLQHDWVS